MSLFKPDSLRHVCTDGRSDMYVRMTWNVHTSGHEYHLQVCALAVLEGSIHGWEAVAGA